MRVEVPGVELYDALESREGGRHISGAQCGGGQLPMQIGLAGTVPRGDLILDQRLAELILLNVTIPAMFVPGGPVGRWLGA